MQYRSVQYVCLLHIYIWNNKPEHARRDVIVNGYFFVWGTPR